MRLVKSNGSSLNGGIVKSGVPVSGLPTNILRGIVPTQSGWDGQTGFGYQAKTGGTVFTDLTAACNNATANDVPFFDAATIQLNDAFYFGDTNIQFNQIKINLGTSGVYAATLVWEYWNGAAWATLTVSDLTLGLTAAPGTYYVTFTVPGDQAKTTVNAQNAYWVRLRISAFTSLTTNPLGTQVWLGAAPTSLANMTDGSFSTVTGTGSVNKGAAGDYGYITFDMGTIRTVLVGGTIGVWSTANTITVFITASDDNITYKDTANDATPTPRGMFGIASTIEKKQDLQSAAVTGRYIRLRFYAGAAATCNMKGYEVMAYELAV